MKNLILSACMTMALAVSCVAPAGPVMLPVSGPLMRQVTRVVERHDAYVMVDGSLSAEARGEYISQSRGAVELMLSMQEVPADLLAPRLAPVLDRHDSYVGADMSLDPLMRDTYLASSSGLRSLMSEARWSR